MGDSTSSCSSPTAGCTNFRTSSWYCNWTNVVIWTSSWSCWWNGISWSYAAFTDGEWVCAPSSSSWGSSPSTTTWGELSAASTWDVSSTTTSAVDVWQRTNSFWIGD